MKVLLIDQIAKVNYKYSFSLANAIRQQNIEIDMVIDQKTEAEGCKCRRKRLFNTDEKNISKIKKVLNYVHSMSFVLRMMKQYDVLHTQWIIFSPMDYYFLKKVKNKGKRLVITIHDILPFNQKFYDYRYHKKIYELADEIIVQAPDNVKRFHALFPDNTVPVSMIPHGHFLNYAENREQDLSREKLDIRKDKFVYLFFGQIKQVKGVDVLLQAYAHLFRSHPELKDKIQLVIAGSVWKTDFGTCEEIIDREGLSDYLKLDIRYIPDEEVDDYYSAADICVLPYREVYQSGVIQLTYAHHKPAVVTRIPAFMDIVDESRGILCEPDDVTSLAEALYEAYESREQLHSMAERGYRYIEENYDWNEIGRRVASLYQPRDGSQL